MDRTRQLFGDRGTEFESYSSLPLECVTAMREIHQDHTAHRPLIELICPSGVVPIFMSSPL
jgi:hypothetical protein